MERELYSFSAPAPGLMALVPQLTAEHYNMMFKALATYMGYFGSRFVGNDIQLICGNLLDTTIGKTFTLFCIMMQATTYNWQIALLMTLVFLVVQYFSSTLSECRPYRDKLSGDKDINIMNTAWVDEKGLDAFNKTPGSVKY